MPSPNSSTGPDRKLLDLTVIVPAYNEEAALDASIRELAGELDNCGLDTEIVIVNDGSEDRTGEIADRLSESLPSVRSIHHAVNQGWGEAVRTGIANAKKELLVLSPVDSPIRRHELLRFVGALGAADIVVGFRSGRAGYGGWLRFGSMCYHRVVTKAFDLRLRDVNWIHLYRKTAVESLPLRLAGIVFPAEVLVKAARRGYRIVEVPSEMRARTSGRPTVSRPRVLFRAVRDLVGLWREMRRPEWRQGH